MKNRLKLDRIYLKILSLLQAQARTPNQQLSEQVGLSPSPCLDRVRKLEQEGYIRGYRADIDLERLCNCITVFATVTLRHHKQDDFVRFDAAVRAIPEIVDCHKVSGTFDYILRFVCTSMSQYDELSDNLLKIGPPIEHMSSHVVLQKTKEFTGYPLERLVQL
ncbi:MAG TPA: Lrp/AsnC family transcriptional regulator [Candidatus Competibacteraceae bacterium]|nr:Lrp/AsnC family transcriptional regulator [Candidatus Competibacteraceae bacterium]